MQQSLFRVPMMFLLECPRCHNRMKYQPAKASSSATAAVDVSKKVKKCVYCNFSMSVAKSVVHNL